MSDETYQRRIFEFVVMLIVGRKRTSIYPLQNVDENLTERAKSKRTIRIKDTRSEEGKCHVIEYRPWEDFSD